MKRGLTIFCAALLATGLAACNRGAGNSDEDRLNAAARALDNNGVYDTSADDAALNDAELQMNQAATGNASGNAATNSAAAAATNRQ